MCQTRRSSALRDDAQQICVTAATRSGLIRAQQERQAQVTSLRSSSLRHAADDSGEVQRVTQRCAAT